MRRKLLASPVLLAALVLGATGAVHAKEAPKTQMGASASMLSNTCAGCHGTDGVSTGPSIPTIAGLSPDYFIDLMAAYKEGDVPSTIMGRIAKGYTDEEIEKMANFYAGKKFVAAKQPFDAKLAKIGAKYHDKNCEKCHAEGGSSAEDDSGILAGQWSTYIDWSLQDFHAGDRPMSKKMAKKLNKLMKKEANAREALVNYYASQQ